jgi:Tfp pilus assembly protein PilF
VTLVSQAVCELHLGRVEEAQAALEQALEKQPDYADAIANLLVLTVITGKDAAALTRYARHQTHQLHFTSIPYPPQMTVTPYTRLPGGGGLDAYT